MFRKSSDEQYAANGEAGIRHLFRLGQYEFHDTLDGEARFHHHVRESTPGGDHSYYEVDRETMYEFMARFLAGEYELEEYRLERSPGHAALLDVLEIATARARAGEGEFSWEEFDPGETEILDDDGDVEGNA